METEALEERGQIEDEVVAWVSDEIASDRFVFLSRVTKKLRKAREEAKLAPFETLITKLTQRLQFSILQKENWNAARRYYMLLDAVGRLPQTAP